MSLRTALALTLSICLVLTIGCGRSGSVSTVDVTGTVTYKGQPVEGASVAFIPQNGPGSSGLTNAQGEFTLSMKDAQGAVEGTHKVVIAKSSGSGSEPPPMPGMPGYEESQAEKPPFPVKYTSDRTTPLSVEVKKGETNHFDIQLED